MSGYRLLARIGEGGMGSVYLSRTRGNQPVALKVIRREYAQDPEFRRRFEQEARSARQVQGYHIVPVVDHDTNGPQPWLATTYVPGLALDDVLALHGPLPPAAALQLTGCAAEALHSVHKAGVIHRDLKPSNVLIGSEGPWVIDFGIARAADATQLTRSGGFIGTPQYMSPEHANGLPLTPATDIFSLGLIAAVCATGRHPYGDSGAITVAAQIANTETRPPDLTGYPEPLRTVLQHCLAADPQARPTPSGLAELCQELSGRQLRDFGGWLPVPVASDIARRERLAETGPETVLPGAPATGGPYGGGTTWPPEAPGTGTGTGTGPAVGTGTGGWGPGGQVPAAAAPPPAGPYGPPVTAPAAPKRRPGLAVVVGAVAVAVAAVAVAGWALTRDQETDPDTGKDRAGGQPASSESAPAPSSAPSSAPSQSKAAATPAAPEAGSYKVVFQGEAFALRYPSTGYTQFDLDTPKAMPLGTDSGQTEIVYSHLGGVRDSYELLFERPMGPSEDASPERCRMAAGANALSPKLDAAQVKKQIVPGLVLCGITKQNKLAMMEVTSVSDNEGRPDFQTRLTLWEMP
ncbi:serine/threonine-protein kinase [Streptomyces sp. NPDC040724]|uniref:serine/threonine-protein kinase n=1 Tax=Streptomyces sp. NPDC040724 TaxID=3155612 RepID=UPI0033FA9762